MPYFDENRMGQMIDFFAAGGQQGAIGEEAALGTSKAVTERDIALRAQAVEQLRLGRVRGLPPETLKALENQVAAADRAVNQSQTQQGQIGARQGRDFQPAKPEPGIIASILETVGLGGGTAKAATPVKPAAAPPAARAAPRAAPARAPAGTVPSADAQAFNAYKQDPDRLNRDIQNLNRRFNSIAKEYPNRKEYLNNEAGWKAATAEYESKKARISRNLATLQRIKSETAGPGAVSRALTRANDAGKRAQAEHGPNSVRVNELDRQLRAAENRLSSGQLSGKDRVYYQQQANAIRAQIDRLRR